MSLNKMNIFCSYQNRAAWICLVSQNSASGFFTLPDDCLFLQYPGDHAAFKIMHAQMFQKKKEEREGTCTHTREKERGREGDREREGRTSSPTHTHIIKAVLWRILKIIFQYARNSWKSYCNEAFSMVFIPSTRRIIPPEMKGSLSLNAGFSWTSTES